MFTQKDINTNSRYNNIMTAQHLHSAIHCLQLIPSFSDEVEQMVHDACIVKLERLRNAYMQQGLSGLDPNTAESIF